LQALSAVSRKYFPRAPLRQLVLPNACNNRASALEHDPDKFGDR
jgi:hypothetical protein